MVIVCGPKAELRVSGSVDQVAFSPFSEQRTVEQRTDLFLRSIVCLPEVRDLLETQRL